MTSPHEQGMIDAREGRTACPFGTEYEARRWAIGFDKERKTTPGPARFGKIAGSRR